MAQSPAEQLTTSADGAGSLDWLADQYTLSLATLDDLGFSESDGIPAFEQIRDAINPALALCLDTREADGCQDELVIAPSIQTVGVMGTRRKPGLIPRFDRKQSRHAKTTVSEDLWGQFGDKAPVHDNGGGGAFSAAILLGDVVDPLNRIQSANCYGEPGLVFTAMEVEGPDGQRTALGHEHVRESRQGREVYGATLGQLVLHSAQRRLAGDPSLGRTLFTLLVHYPNRPVGERDRVPNLAMAGGRLLLGKSYVDYASPDAGVQRVLRLALV